jgi:hypothetical protein
MEADVTTTPDRATPRPRVALLWRGDPANPDQPTRYAERLGPVFEALRAAGLDPHPAVYFDETAEATLKLVLSMKAALVWINPLADGRDRKQVDALLRTAGDAGVFVSAHPDVIDKMGSKNVLVSTRDLGWAGDVRSHLSVGAMMDSLRGAFARGETRVLKPVRGNDGQGVVKVSAAAGPGVMVQHASDDRIEAMSLHDLEQLVRPALEAHGRIIDQPFNANPGAGMVRCYMVRERVAGFAAQQPRIPDGEAFGMNSAKSMHPAEAAGFQDLRVRMEAEWTPGLQALLGIATPSLPLLWDADFLIRPDAQAVQSGRYMLCEINVSCVSPFPDTVPTLLAAALAAELGLRDPAP